MGRSEGEMSVARAPVRGRPRPSRTRIAVRRLMAFLLIGGAAAVGVWLVSEAIKGDPKKPKAVPPKVVTLRIVFPEGFTRAQMAERIVAVNKIAVRKRGVDPRLSSKTYLAATASSLLPATFNGDKKRRSLEGFLFPATYDFFATTTSKKLVADQLKAFRRNWKKIDLRYARSKNLTAYDVLNIASMVEEEVLAPDERAKVAAVIYNRLHARMPLGIDATIRYGLHIPPDKSLTKSELRSRNPYNTRVHRGLPPTPIGNPGLASIQAAAHPAKVKYLYFVRKPDKVHHYFTASYADFLRYLKAHGYPTP
jgi:peptidoglycan lytic transglycosylase G